ncbi:glycoside hydrolase 61 [Paraphaeosphaeria minitans]|uniref:Glycosyl hydrolase family 61 n=1 Tax=Paraphaeosphaeria minitans TaxID=565426 RepID=A0A9P6GF68_9PLEO|nr:glycosyl hydrolase family 61 [Paraphaeosphaeria minitans]
MKASLAVLVASAAAVMGHGFVNEFTTDGKSNQGFLLDYYYQKVNTGSFPSIAAWYAENLDSGFVAPNAYQSADINCHKNSAPGALTATVKAGGSLTFTWGPNAWPHPYGPVLGYVAACNGDCSKVVKTNLQWVKIQAEGIDYASQVWASQKLLSQGGKWTLTVPASLKAGNYVFRHEIIALHGANSPNGAQNYPQCFNIAVTGSGTKTLPAGTLGTALYKADDKGILMNPYMTITSYAMPGPTLWSG